MNQRKIEVVFEKLYHNVILPQKMSAGSSGYDIRAYLEGPVVIPPKERAIIPTGLKMMMPDCLEAQIRPRSGLAFKYGIMVVNSPGTIDADYRGEIKVILYNSGNTPFKVNQQDRIAQMVFCQVPNILINEGKITGSGRESGGFGSTGTE